MRKAFTIVELLIVIGIVSALVVLALPVLTSVREPAPSAQWQQAFSSNSVS